MMAFNCGAQMCCIVKYQGIVKVGCGGKTDTVHCIVMEETEQKGEMHDKLCEFVCIHVDVLPTLYVIFQQCLSKQTTQVNTLQ